MSDLVKTDHFETKAKNTKFYIKVNCKLELIDDNLREIIESGERRPHDRAIYNHRTGGIDIKDSLTLKQKGEIKEAIKKITNNDFDYCVENDIVGLSGHILDDYCKNNKDELIKRGWPTEEDDLVEETIYMLCNVVDVVKAKIKFELSGKSFEKLTYTVIGSHGGYSGSLAINFQSQMSQDSQVKENILTVTVLQREKN